MRLISWTLQSGSEQLSHNKWFYNNKSFLKKSVLWNRSRNRIILTQEEPEPEPYPCSRFRFRLRFRFQFLLQKKYQTTYISSDGTLADTCMKLAREETKIKVTGSSFYRKNNLKFEGRNRNRGQNIWDPEPEPEPRQNGTVPQHWKKYCNIWYK